MNEKSNYEGKKLLRGPGIEINQGLELNSTEFTSIINYWLNTLEELMQLQPSPVTSRSEWGFGKD